MCGNQLYAEGKPAGNSDVYYISPGDRRVCIKGIGKQLANVRSSKQSAIIGNGLVQQRMLPFVMIVKPAASATFDACKRGKAIANVTTSDTTHFTSRLLAMRRE